MIDLKLIQENIPSEFSGSHNQTSEKLPNMNFVIEKNWKLNNFIKKNNLFILSNTTANINRKKKQQKLF